MAVAEELYKVSMKMTTLTVLRRTTLTTINITKITTVNIFNVFFR